MLSLHLETFSGPNYPPYIALSYEWGPKTSDEPAICIDSHTLPIRRILHNFLLHLQKLSDADDKSLDADNKPVWYWADAICINQGDNNEKSVQVQRMNEIYEGAARMLGWVWGSKIPTSPTQSQLDHETIASNSAAFLTLQRWSPESKAEEKYLTLEDEQHVVGLQELLVFPKYWTRRWIIQELVLPRKVTLIFSTVHIPLEQIVTFFRAASSYWATLKGHRYIYKQLKTKDKNRLYEHDEAIYRLYMLEREFSKCQAAKICTFRDQRERSWAHILQPRAKITGWDLVKPRLPEFRLDEGLRHFVNFDCGHPLDVVYAIVGLVRTLDRPTMDYSLAPIDLIKLIYEKLTTRRPGAALKSQVAFLYARFLISKMYRDLDTELQNCVSSSSRSGSHTPLGIDVIARRCYFVDGHISSLEKLVAAGDDGHLMRGLGDEPPRPLQPWPTSARQSVSQDLSLSISPEGVLGHTNTSAVAGETPTPLPRWPSFEQPVTQDLISSISTEKEIHENTTAKMDETPESIILRLEAEIRELTEMKDKVDKAAAVVDAALGISDIVLSSSSGDRQEDRHRRTLGAAMRGGFWDRPSRGPVFWERRLRGAGLGVYELVPGSAMPKTRDDNWDTDLEHRFFIAHNSRGVLDRRKAYGVSEFPIEKGDEIWQIPGIEMALVLRNDGNEYRVVSRAYLYDNFYKDNKLRSIFIFLQKLEKDEVNGETFSWNCLKPNTSFGERTVIRLDLPFLLELSR